MKNIFFFEDKFLRYLNKSFSLQELLFHYPQGKEEQIQKIQFFISFLKFFEEIPKTLLSSFFELSTVFFKKEAAPSIDQPFLSFSWEEFLTKYCLFLSLEDLFFVDGLFYLNLTAEALSKLLAIEAYFTIDFKEVIFVSEAYTLFLKYVFLEEKKKKQLLSRLSEEEEKKLNAFASLSLQSKLDFLKLVKTRFSYSELKELLPSKETKALSILFFSNAFFSA